MSRARVSYAGHAPASASPRGIDPDTPVAGFYRMRLRSGAVFVAVRIWHGAPVEPWTGETMDRAPCWNATINGAWANIEDVWPRCAAQPIDAAEAHYLTSLHAWAIEHAPRSPQANPTQRVNLLTAPIPL